MTLTIISGFVTLLIVAIGLRPFRRYLENKRLLDHPNERSSHTGAIPRGAGVFVVPVLLSIWLLSHLRPETLAIDREVLLIATPALLLCVLSWLDDLNNLPTIARLLIHVVACAFYLLLTESSSFLLQGIVPLWADFAFTLLAWVWFINLFNFMDGINGITGVQTISICAGVIVTSVVGSPADLELILLSAILLGSMCGFLIWNWHPAKVFLGDSGSVPLGYLTGWLLISIASDGHWYVALVLPAYYLADSTITLSRRVLRGDAFWRAHKEHFYQMATASMRHDQVCVVVMLTGAALIVCAVSALLVSLTYGLLGAATVVLICLFVMRHAASRPVDIPTQKEA